MIRHLKAPISPSGKVLLAGAVRVARGHGHRKVEPLHLLLAHMCQTSETPMWPPAEVLVNDLNSRLGIARASGTPPDASRALRQCLNHVQARCARRGRQVDFEDLLVEVLRSPGVHARTLRATRSLALADLRRRAGSCTIADRLRLSTHGIAERIASAFGRALARLRRGPIGPALRWAGRRRAQLGTLWRGLMILVAWPVAVALVPGWVVREGSRVVTAIMARTSVRYRSIVRSLGADFELEPPPSPASYSAVILVPHFVVFLVGLMYLLPAILDEVAYGRSILPAVTSLGGGAFRLPSGGADQFFAGATFNTYVGITCLFVALPKAELLREARFQLRGQRLGGLALSAALMPLQLTAALVAPLDRLIAAARFNALAGSGLVGVIGGMILLRMLAAAWLGV